MGLAVAWRIGPLQDALSEEQGCLSNISTAPIARQPMEAVGNAEAREGKPNIVLQVVEYP